MQDAVILALKNLKESDLPKISEGYALSNHLSRRGFLPEELSLPFKPASYSEIIQLIMNDEYHVVGSF